MPLQSWFHRARSATFAIGLAVIYVPNVKAHFLFARIGPIAEGGRSVEVYFSEQARAGDPRFIPKIAHTRLWAQTAPGEFHELNVRTGTDRLRAILPTEESLGVVGECRYGVLSRPGQEPFLLRHYPKAIAGQPQEINRLARRPEIPFEIVPTFEVVPNSTAPDGKTTSSKINLVALRNGKPIPGATFHAVDSDLVEVEFVAGRDGVASWCPPAPSYYCFYVAEVLKESGALDGKRYNQVRDFATLSLDWPLRQNREDAEATKLFQSAVANRAQWRDFPGFTAEITGDLNGRAFDGNVKIDSTGKVEIKIDDEPAKSWIEDQLESLVMHRLPTPSTKPSALHPSQSGSDFTLRFGDDSEDHPLGRLLLVNQGRMASSYRIKDGEIKVVNRSLGQSSMTLVVLSNNKNPEGHSLPQQYVVNYWDTDTGRLIRSETVQERWQRVAQWDLPTSHTVTTASDGGLATRVFTLVNHKLLETR